MGKLKQWPATESYTVSIYHRWQFSSGKSLENCRGSPNISGAVEGGGLSPHLSRLLRSPGTKYIQSAYLTIIITLLSYDVFLCSIFRLIVEYFYIILWKKTQTLKKNNNKYKKDETKTFWRILLIYYYLSSLSRNIKFIEIHKIIWGFKKYSDESGRKELFQ